MQIYHYHPDTGEFMGSGEADADPVVPNNYLIPAHATPVAPPALGPNEAAVYQGGAWAIAPDHRGAVYWLADKTRHEITALGEVPPLGALAAPPPPTLAELKADKVAALSAACKAAIVAGFPSAALGEVHTYDSDMESQINLVGAAALAGPVAYTCTDGAGVKASRAHTAAEIAQVLADGAALKIGYLARFRDMRAQAMAAPDAAALDLIAW